MQRGYNNECRPGSDIAHLLGITEDELGQLMESDEILEITQLYRDSYRIWTSATYRINYAHGVPPLNYILEVFRHGDPEDSPLGDLSLSALSMQSVRRLLESDGCPAVEWKPLDPARNPDNVNSIQIANEVRWEIVYEILRYVNHTVNAIPGEEGYRPTAHLSDRSRSGSILSAWKKWFGGH